MRIVRKTEKMKNIVKCLKSQNIKTGFIPTMGALHEGHLSLMDRSKKDECFSLVSIFLNPIQFGENEDLAIYPKPFERDIKLCTEHDASIIFAPDNNEMYPEKQDISIKSESFADLFCGASRPGHFKGVLIIVAKLLNIIKPDIAYFGEKDYQQAILISSMARELNFDTAIKVCPTIRDKDGLALSSRNSYLSPQDREKAPFLYKSFLRAHELIKSGKLSTRYEIIESIKKFLLEKIANIDIDYIDVVYDHTLTKAGAIDRDIRILGAVKIGNTRLIDNYRITL